MVSKIKAGVVFAALATACTFQAPLRAQDSTQQEKAQSDTMKQDSMKQDGMKQDKMGQDKMSNEKNDGQEKEGQEGQEKEGRQNGQHERRQDGGQKESELKSGPRRESGRVEPLSCVPPREQTDRRTRATGITACQPGWI
jgi:pentapeptide MXKDX repeat protein